MKCDDCGIELCEDCNKPFKKKWETINPHEHKNCKSGYNIALNKAIDYHKERIIFTRNKIIGEQVILEHHRELLKEYKSKL